MARRYLQVYTPENRAVFEDVYPASHKLGMKVPASGSSCAKCLWGHNSTGGPWCANEGWVHTPKRHGGGGGNRRLPVLRAYRYCCDLYQTRSRC